ncbi:hypothetical protein C0995_006078 [Termitomyces sp. Mi166|nr:hypothetical protein C0995_006078 [Termitomyces sp. Mi166\
MSIMLAFNPKIDDKRPLAEVKVTKLKDCPMLTPGRMDDYTFQQWAIACKRYQKHSRKSDDEIVSFIADGMLEPRFDVRDTILASYQGNISFADWAVVIQDLNAQLSNTKSPYTLDDKALQAHFESHMRPDLHRKKDVSTLNYKNLTEWILLITELDEGLAEERAQTQALINANNTEWASQRKPLAERISEPPSRTTSTSSTTATSTPNKPRLAKLTDDKKKLLAEHQGCTRCRTFYCDHPRDLDKCHLKATNSWPNPTMTKTLTLAMALAAKPKHVAGMAYVQDISEEA